VTELTLTSKIQLNPAFYPKVEIPRLGLGVWQTGKGCETYDAVRAALDSGYRHIDTAKIYGNEQDVGRAVRESNVPRTDIFVTTKLWNADHGYDQAKRACEKSLSALGLDYVDLYLIHWPERRRLDSWRALVELHQTGRCRAIGVSNFTTDHLEELLHASNVVPAVNQVEIHPFLTQEGLVAFCEENGIVIEAYSPLTHGKRLGHPAVVSVARKLGKTPAQVLIRWSLQRGFVVLPKSANKSRIVENASVYDFAISPDDMQMLDQQDEDLRTCWDPTDAP
jgi:diketogulonate reductase-like aldo/keto reductase